VTIHISIATPVKGSTGKPVVQYNFDKKIDPKTGKVTPLPLAWFVKTEQLSKWRY